MSSSDRSLLARLALGALALCGATHCIAKDTCLRHSDCASSEVCSMGACIPGPVESEPAAEAGATGGATTEGGSSGGQSMEGSAGGGDTVEEAQAPLPDAGADVTDANALEADTGVDSAADAAAD
jgi:hypothetical protein